MASWIEQLGSIGDFVGGIATAVAVCLGVREVHRWRDQRAQEKKSETAARALVALTRATDAIVAWAEELEDITDVEDPEMDFKQLGEQFQAADRRGRRASEQSLRDLHATTAEAYVHLETDQAKFLSYVYDMSGEMHEHVDGFLAGLEFAPGASRLDAVRRIRTTLREGRQIVQEQLQKGSAVLQPIARFKR